MKLELNKNAPDFTLPDQENKFHSLSDYKGNWVLLYFYPKDDTPGCTVEACQIRDNFPNFKDLNITVLGISKDSVKSHKKFAEKHELPFVLLADENKEINNLYGVWKQKKFMGKEFMGTERTSFLVDPHGTLVKIYGKVKPKEHANEVLLDVKNFTN